MINLKKITSRDIYKALNVFATVNNKLRELNDVEDYLSFYNNNKESIYMLAVESDNIGRVQQVNLTREDDRYLETFCKKHKYEQIEYQLIERKFTNQEVIKYITEEIEGLINKKRRLRSLAM